jgi:hypothetical protein
MSKKRQRLNYKQYSMSFRRSGDMASMSFDNGQNNFRKIADLLASPLAKYIIDMMAQLKN